MCDIIAAISDPAALKALLRHDVENIAKTVTKW